LTDNEWEFTPAELRLAAKVARASGGLILPAAASAWEHRADMIDLREGWA